MVKFGRQLEFEAVTEWREYYLDYKLLRKELKKNKVYYSFYETKQAQQNAVQRFFQKKLLREIFAESESFFRDKVPLLFAKKSEIAHLQEEDEADEYSAENKFIGLLRKELLKIEKFYSEKVNYYSETLEILKEKADTLTTQGDEKGLYHIKQSFVELFRRINLGVLLFKLHRIQQNIEET
jgi:SPX domain protein involved in polyphosphate accumulation